MRRRIEPHEEGVHLRVYEQEDPMGLPSQYEFRVANGPKARAPVGARLVATKKVLRQFQPELKAFLGTRKQRKIGGITYEISSVEATSTKYYPKKKLKGASLVDRPTPGLGAFLEAVAASDAKKDRGIQDLSTTSAPSIQRVGQLHKAGLIELSKEELALLKSGNEVDLALSLKRNGKLPISHPIEDWLRGLGKVIHASQKKEKGD